MQVTTSKKLLSNHVAVVSSHRSQTLLVNALLESGFLDVSDVRNLEDPETGEPRAIYEWHDFVWLGWYEYDALERAGVPLLRSEYGTWVGFDSFGSPYDLYVRPQLIKAIYGIDTDCDWIRMARKD